MATNSLGDFTQQATAYAQSRPGYPAGLIEQLLRTAKIQPGDAIADLGAGTGLLTQMLSGRGFRIYAIEPNRVMRQEAPSLPDVTWIDGTFEHTDLAPCSIQYIISAQAFHWADPPRALPEMHRILSPGGAFTILWNDRLMDRAPLLCWIRDLLRRHAPHFNEAYRGGDWANILTSTGHFAHVRIDTAEHMVPMSADRFLNLWRSHNRLTVTIGKDHLEAMLTELSTHLRQENVTYVEVPYRTQTWTAWRL